MENNKGKLLLVFLIFNCSFAFSQSIIRILSNNRFIVTNDFYEKGQRLFIYKEDKLMAKARVKICAQTKCRAQITKARKNFKLSEGLTIRSKPIKKKKKKKPKKKKKKKKKKEKKKEPEEKEEEEEPEEEDEEESGIKDNGVLISFGGPLLLEFRFAYRRNLSKKLILYGVYDYINTSLAQVKLEGYGIGLGAEYRVFGDLFGYFEYGMISTSIDFTPANVEGPTLVEEGVTYMNLGGTYLKRISESIQGLARLGYAMNEFEESYENDSDKIFSTPFAGSLVVFELGLIFKF